MAEEETQEKTEEQAETLQIGPAEPEQKKGNRWILIIIAGVVFLVIVIAALVAFLILSTGKNGGVTGTEEETEFVKQYNQRMQSSLDPNYTPIFAGPFTFNVNLKNGKNYLHLQFRAQLKDPKAEDFLESRTPLIDDKIISLLKNKLPQDLRTRTGLELLKQEIFIEMNKMFPQEFIDQSESKDRMPVKDILIVQYYIQ